MKYKLTTVVIFSLLLISCNVSKSSKKGEEVQKMLADGFKAGVIVYSEEKGDCEYSISVEGEASYMLDPIELSEEFKKDQMKIWFTYRGLRMKNRCKKAAPIEITEIQKRAN